MSTALADYWHFLTQADKDFLLYLLKRYDKGKYGNFSYGHLILVDLKLLRKLIKNAPKHVGYMDTFLSQMPHDARNRALASSRKRLRKKLSPELLHQWQKNSANRERRERQLADRAHRKAMKKGLLPHGLP